MTIDEIHELVGQFGDAALRCKKAGVDGVELHCAHGYLLQQFLSPYTNYRDDEYGGSFENRMRFITEIAEGVNKFKGDKVLSIRFNGTDWHPVEEGGMSVEDGVEVAKYLEKCPKVERVIYPGLESDPCHALAQKYLKGCSGVISLVIKGGRQAAMKFMNSLKLASNEVHVADIRTCVLHPASETHRQLTDEQLVAAGIEAGMVRLSVGLEDVKDILADLEQGFAAI